MNCCELARILARETRCISSIFNFILACVHCSGGKCELVHFSIAFSISNYNPLRTVWRACVRFIMVLCVVINEFELNLWQQSLTMRSGTKKFHFVDERRNVVIFFFCHFHNEMNGCEL